MTVRNPLELAAGCVLFGGALFMLSQTTTFYSMEDVGLGARFFPRVLFTTIAVLSLSLVKNAVAWSEKKAAAAEKKEKDPLDATGLQWAYIGVLFLYILVMRHMGYGVSTFAFCFILMTMLGPKTPGTVCLNAVFSAITAGLLVYVFGTLLDLFLPG